MHPEIFYRDDYVVAQTSGIKCDYDEQCSPGLGIHCYEQLSFNCQRSSLFSHHPIFIKAETHFCSAICFEVSCQLWEVIILALNKVLL